MQEEEIHMLEESLKEYLAECNATDTHGIRVMINKYNNLRIYMDPKKNPKPHFIIRIGISEAMFDLDSREKMSGGLGPDERDVRRWMERNLYRVDLKSKWKQTQKVKEIKKEDVDRLKTKKNE